VKLKNKLVARIKVTPTRPSGWNYDGEMDEYVGQLVLIIDSDEFIRCKPLFNSLDTSYDWVFTKRNFVKANTLQDEIPDWAIKGKNDMKRKMEMDEYMPYDDPYDDSQEQGFIDDFLKEDD
jgi:hypothetical protein